MCIQNLYLVFAFKKLHAPSFFFKHHSLPSEGNIVRSEKKQEDSTVTAETPPIPIPKTCAVSQYFQPTSPFLVFTSWWNVTSSFLPAFDLPNSTLKD
jgi:hypothetical protein